MDYMQPPAIVISVSQNERPSCEDILKKARKGVIPEYSFKDVLDENSLKFFKLDDLKLEDKVDESKNDFLTAGLKRQISHKFYRIGSSKREWDIVLTYSTDNGMPRIMYVAIGEIKQKAILSQRDLIFHFYHNPLDANEKDFKFANLIMYTPRVVYSCNPFWRFYFNKLLNNKKAQLR